MVKTTSRRRSIARSNEPTETVRGPKVGGRSRKGQPELFDDPMPQRVKPCLAEIAYHPPKGPGWAYEVKWDGYRLAVHVDAEGKVRLLTRGGHDWTSRFPAIRDAAEKLNIASCILDGEAVVLDQNGVSDFGALQAALGGRGGRRSSEGVIFYAFDILYLDGRDLRPLPLSERREKLAPIIPTKPGSIRLSEEVVADGEAFLRIACEMHLEGIIAKRLNAPYRSGRGGEWKKIKCLRSETFVIIGYHASRKALGGIAKLLLAARSSRGLVFVGSVGTGFTAKSAAALKGHLETIEIATPPAEGPKSARWVRPELAAEIEFLGLTDGAKLRHASYKGLRDASDEDRIYVLDNPR